MGAGHLLPSRGAETERRQAHVGEREPQAPSLVFRPLTPRLMDDLGTVLSGSWGAGCWCMYPRLTNAQMRELERPGLVERSGGARR